MRSTRARARASLATQALCSLGLAGTVAAGVPADSWAGTGKATPPDVFFNGCRVTRTTKDGSVCIPTADGILTFWIRGRSCDELQVAHEGRSLSVTTKTVQDGCQIKTVALAFAGTTSLVISHRDTGQAFWILQIGRSEPEFLEWTQRIQSRSEADLTEVANELRHKKSIETRPDKIIDYTFASAWSHRRLGQLDLARQEYREVIELAKVSGYSSIAVDALYRLAHTLRISGLIPEARETIAEAEVLMTRGHGKEHNDWEYHNANILQDEGRLTEAADWFGRVLDDAEKIDHQERMRIATMCLAELFVRQDMIASAQKLLGTFDLLLSNAAECEEKVNLLALKGWVDLQVTRSENLQGILPGIAQPHAKLILFEALRVEAQCKNNHNRANIYTNLAEAALLESNLTEAQEWIERAFKVPGLPIFDELELLNLKGKVELQGGRPKLALRSFERLNKFSQENLDVAHRLYECSSALGTLESLRALGQPTGASSEMVKSCLDNKAKTLGPWDLKNLRSHARGTGIIN